MAKAGKPKTQTKSKMKTKPTGAAAAPAKPAKVPIATLRDVEKDLQETSHDAQVALVWRTLAQFPAERRGHVAAAALAHTKKGSPLARGVLASVADGTSSDGLVRHAAAMPRGRGQVFGALVSLWQLATDVDALEAAYTNFARSFVDNPRLLELGIHAATRRGDAASAAARERALACARRVAPLVDELHGNAAAQKRAAATVKTLDAEDRRQLYLRILEAPKQASEELAIAAVDATILDPTVGDGALVNAVVAMRYHGSEQLVDAWKARVKTDAALRGRLVSLLDWLGDHASDDDQLEPFIHALAPVGGEPEVFALVMRLFASANPITRATVCEEWVREDDGRAAFSNDQMAAVMREVVRLALPGEDKQDDSRAAGRALFYGHHPGARAVLMDAIRTAKPSHDKLRWNCYFGLDEDAPDIRAFMIERLFDEDDEYWALLEWFEDHTDAGVHREVLDALAARRSDAKAVHAATAYFDAMFDKKQAPRFAIGLARAVADWTAATKEDGRRLRYIFEAGTAAALQVNDPASARVLLARVEDRKLPSPAYSDYQEVDRDNKTKAHLADKEVKKQLAALAAGKLDAAIDALRAQANAARAKTRPVALSDADLGLLAGCAVGKRLLDDTAAKVAWFFDEVGTLYAYDGYDVTPATAAGIAWTRLDWKTAPCAVVGTATQPADERAVFATGKATALREVARHGRHLLVYTTEGAPNWTGRARVSGYGLTLASVDAARDAFARFAASPPAGMQRRDPWYVDNRGAVSREYSIPTPTGGHEQAVIAVVGSEIRGRFGDGLAAAPRHASPDAAIAAFAAWEAGVHAAGGQLTEIGVDKEATLREDTTIAAYFEERYREDGKDAVWHARAIAEMVQAVRDAGLDDANEVACDAGPPATADAIAAYQATVPEPLPETLVAVWREVGPFGFTTTTRSVRLLGPAELVARRDELRASLRAWAPAHLKASRAKQLAALADHCDVIALDDDGPAILFDTRQQHADGRCFSSDGGWWEVAFGWCIAVDIAAPLKMELDRRFGAAHLLKLGQRASGDGEHARLAQADKTFEAIAEGAQTLTRTSSAKGPGKPAIKTHADAAAAKAFVKAAVAAHRANGWR
jgi:hypothetical protein